jgi:hypothetical protein
VHPGAAADPDAPAWWPASAVHDERAWFDVSSYGPKAVDATLRVVGVDRLVHGTDRPVVDPPSLAPLGPAFRHAVARVNLAQVLARSSSPSSSGSSGTSPGGPRSGRTWSSTAPIRASTPSCAATSTSASG